MLSGDTVESAVGPVGLLDGVMLGNGFNLDVIESARIRLPKGAHEAGRDVGAIDLMAAGIIHVSEDGENARKLARRRIANRAHHNFRLSLDPVPEDEREGVRRFMEAFDISKPLEERVPVELVSDYLVHRFTISGTPQECVERVRELKSIGVESFLVTPPEYAWEDVARLWAEEVMRTCGELSEACPDAAAAKSDDPEACGRASPVGRIGLHGRVGCFVGVVEGGLMSFSDVYRAIRYRANDPLRYLHVPRRERLDSDPARGTNLEVRDELDIDLDPAFRGAVVPEAELG